MFKHLQSSKCLRLSKIISARCGHTLSANQPIQQKFRKEMTDRFAQAKRSFLIETPSSSFHPMVDYCARFGSVNNIYSHETPSRNYYLIEYTKASDLDNFMCKSMELSSRSSTTRFLKFDGKTMKQRNVLNRTWKKEQNTSHSENIIQYMSSYSTSDEQILALYNRNSISDLSTRLRFLTALQVEEAVSAFYPKVRVIPFGSSVNGFGRMQSDLDMVLVYDETSSNEIRPMTKSKSNRKYTSTLSNVKNDLNLIVHVLEGWLPGVNDVDPILNARVPIIKYHQSYTGLDCDLSSGNISGHQMSDLFYTFSTIDRRVRPLVFYIRRWAEECKVIHGFQPSPHITNYMLTCMVIFVLQRLQEPVLPPARTFCPKVLQASTAEYITSDTVKFVSKNDSSLRTLLVDFFTFYSSFNFDRQSICIADAKTKTNPHRTSIFIYNPLERQLNVCRNVIDFERDKFVEQCKLARHRLVVDKLNAVQLLQSYTDPIHKPNDSAKNQNCDDFIDSIVEQRTVGRFVAKKKS